MGFIKGERCVLCERPIRPGEDFVLVGKYPSRGSRWFKSAFLNYTDLSWFGALMHLACASRRLGLNLPPLGQRES